MSVSAILILVAGATHIVVVVSRQIEVLEQVVRQSIGKVTAVELQAKELLQISASRSLKGIFLDVP